MFETTSRVIWALKRYQDVFDPKCGSVIIPVKGRSEHTSEPFKPGFLHGIDTRDELLYRMRTRLDDRERLLLVFWYIADLRPGEVARRIHVSRMHAYRLKKKALWALVDNEAKPEDAKITYGGWKFSPVAEAQPSASPNGNGDAPQELPARSGYHEGGYLAVPNEPEDEELADEPRKLA